MANVKKIAPKIRKWEGEFGNDPADPGGATKWGVTIGTFRSVYGNEKTIEDLKNMTEEQWTYILKVIVWDRWKADEIKSQSIAEILVDWVWASGKYGITEGQKVLGVNPDGIVGSKTIGAINNYPNQEELHDKFYKARMDFIDRITKNSVEKYQKEHPTWTERDLMKHTFKKFQQGWKNRINDAYKNYSLN